ncbi:hypothetical protein ACX40Y_07195 [Sphingomonas sp. RS6]
MIRPGYWFRPKTIGYGATPVTWQGWSLVLAFIAAVVSIGHLSRDGQPWLLALLVPLTLGLIWLTRRKTDGDWHWRPRR